MRGCSKSSAANSESHVPCFQERVDTGTHVLSGCRGVKGLVPQPLCMKFKSAEADRNTSFVTQGRRGRKLWRSDYRCFHDHETSRSARGRQNLRIHQIPSLNVRKSSRPPRPRQLGASHMPKISWPGCVQTPLTNENPAVPSMP